MSLVTCGSALRTKVPYTKEVNSLLWSVVVSSSHACESECGGSDVLAPISSLSLSQCGACLNEKALADEQLQYGCHWCTSVMARLQYVLSPRVPVWSDVISYLDGSRELVDAAWAELSPCERGRWVADSCMLAEFGLPYAATFVPEVPDNSKSQSEVLAWILSSIGLALMMGVVGYAVYHKRLTATNDYQPAIYNIQPDSGEPDIESSEDEISLP